MRSEDREKPKRKRKEAYYERREVEKNGETYTESSHYYKSIIRKGHHEEIVEEQKYRKETKGKADHSASRKHESKRKHRSVSPSQEESLHVDAPVKQDRGHKRRDSSGDESPVNVDVKKKHRKHKKKHRAESFEELSRRKRKIESELNALDAEEAERKSSRNRAGRRQSELREGISKYIKQEPISDDERKSRNRKRDSSNDQRQMRNASVSSSDANAKTSKKPDKAKPNFQTSGKLAEDTNTFNGVVIKYNEPPEARKPKRKWRLYPFKGDNSLPFIPLHRQSAYLFGRTRLIADIPIDHPSCSKQHAVLQFRLIPYQREDGTTGKRVRPYIIDLESSNGTFVNNKKAEPRRYVELLEKDVVKFGFSTREYVLLHEESKNESDDDDVVEGESKAT